MSNDACSLNITKKVVAVGTLSLLVIYVLAYIEETSPVVHIARITDEKTSTTSSTTAASAAASSSGSSGWPAQCVQKGQQYARVFGSNHHNQNNNNNSSSPPWWCTQDAYDRRSCKNKTQKLCSPPTGLLFVKTPKTGSTTISRIVKRMVHNVAQRSNSRVCRHREDHVAGAGLWYANRDRKRSFLLASLRDPAQRAMSRFFWSYVTRHSHNHTTEVTADDAFIQRYLDKSTNVANGCTSKGQGGYQLNYISMSTIPEYSAWNPQTPTAVVRPEQVETHVKDAMMDYDFILLNERMDESLVVLQFLLGLQTGDIVSLSYNVGGSFRYEHGKCKELIKSHTSPGMQEYFQSDEWYAKNYGDYLLYAAVNRSLDMTIDKFVGKKQFDAAMQEFKRLEAKVNEICTEKVPFPCSPNGTVLFHAQQAVPHDKIAQCIDEIVRLEAQEINSGMTEKLQN